MFRFREPIFHNIVLIEVKTWFGIIPEEDDKSSDAFSLMIQQLCTDLVYTILYTVTKHTVGIKKQGRWTVYQPYDFSNKNKFVIETMLVKSSFFKKGEETTEGETTKGSEVDELNKS